MEQTHFIKMLIVLFCLNSCTSKHDNYLNKGLYELQNKVAVNKTVITGFEIQTLGIIKSEEQENTFDFVFLLNDDISQSLINTYNISLKAQPFEDPKDENQLTTKQLLWDFKPEILKKNRHKYIVTTVSTTLSRIKELKFSLYSREDNQAKTFGEVITIGNIAIY